MNNLYRYDQIDETFYGNNEHLNRILKWYHEFYDPYSTGATVLVPIGALGAIERLAELSSNQMLILSGDKGHNNPDHFRGIMDPHIAVHGSFSVMYNWKNVNMKYKSRLIFLLGLG